MRRGFSLLATLCWMALTTSAGLVTLAALSSLQHGLVAHQLHQQASAMALSGADYAQAQIRSGAWRGDRTFRSPVFRGELYFEVEISHGQISSIGHARAASCRVEVKP